MIKKIAIIALVAVLAIGCFAGLTGAASSDEAKGARSAMASHESFMTTADEGERATPDSASGFMPRGRSFYKRGADGTEGEPTRPEPPFGLKDRGERAPDCPNAGKGFGFGFDFKGEQGKDFSFKFDFPDMSKYEGMTDEERAAAMTEDFKAKLDEKVAAGSVTREQADLMLERFSPLFGDGFGPLPGIRGKLLCECDKFPCERMKLKLPCECEEFPCEHIKPPVRPGKPGEPDGQRGQGEMGELWREFFEERVEKSPQEWGQRFFKKPDGEPGERTFGRGKGFGSDSSGMPKASAPSETQETGIVKI